MKIKRNTSRKVHIVLDDVPTILRSYYDATSGVTERRYVIGADVRNTKLNMERYLVDLSVEEVARLVMQAPDIELRLGATGAVTFMNNLRTVLK